MSGGHLRERRLIPLVQRLYDVIGDGYAATRLTEPRIAARIWQGSATHAPC
jgi:hypothetical protein